jgi:hypothetical protein
MPQQQPYILAGISLVASILTGLTAAYFTARWAVNNTLKSKWWKKQEQAYTDIIEALYSGMLYQELLLDACHNPNQREDFKKIEAKARKADSRIEKEAAIGEFVISEKASLRLKQFTTRKRPVYNQSTNPFDCISENIEAYKATLEDFRELARKHLKIKSF